MLTELAVLIWEEVGSSTVLRCKLGWKVRSSHVRCKRPNSYLLTRMFPYSWMKWFLHRRHTYTIRTTLEHRAKIVVQKVTGIQSVDYVTDPSLHTSFQDDVGWHTRASIMYPYCCLPCLTRTFKETKNILSSNWVNLRNFYPLGCARVVFCQVGMPLPVYARYLRLSRTIDM